MELKPSPKFDPVSFTVVPPRRFEDLRVDDVFRAPSRTLTDAHAARAREIARSVSSGSRGSCSSIRDAWHLEKKWRNAQACKRRMN